mmetsp:Transcript_3483/g.6077  ORF Transcript_3483/g.6077 Transcript_3483/m.6077 type:complete len:423 (+) Transcript_3483:535-1803(+)
MNSPLVVDSPLNHQATTASMDQPLPQPQVQVDLSDMVGRIKPPPVCVDATLKQEAMSAEELSKFAFSVVETTPPKSNFSRADVSEPSVVSSGSSTGSRESAYLSDLETSAGHGTHSGLMITNNNKVVPPSTTKGASMSSRIEDSERINLKVTTQKISRNGRLTQRWFTCPSTQRVYQMTTGCVPVVEGGKILFVSSSRKPEWILPKGGWEMDEAMEESAIRETFEEAGVLGILGPLLGEIEYETRKAKKRRIEYEELQRKAKKLREAHSPQSVSAADNGSKGEDVAKLSAPPAISSTPVSVSAASQVDNEVLGSMRGQSKMPPSDGDTCSVASEASQTYSHVRMSLFPLYVTEIKKNWPEQGRFRKAVDIDEAIKMTESRPEFQAALKELKERNLHFPVQPQLGQKSEEVAKNPASSAADER